MKKCCIILVLWACVVAGVYADEPPLPLSGPAVPLPTEPADTLKVDQTYFHPAASLFIQGDLPAASNLVVKGLSVYPNDSKLKELKKLIEQQQKQKQQQQNQQNQNQQNKDKKNQDKNKQDQQNQNKNQQNQQNKEQQKKNQEQKKKDQQKQNQEQEKQDNQSPQNADQQEAQPEGKQPGEMSKDEAKQLLDAMKQDEKNKRLQLHPVMGAPVNVDKDW